MCIMKCDRLTLMSNPVSNGYSRKTQADKQRNVRMPLRYNNDKRKKPLFSRGLSVCRHLLYTKNPEQRKAAENLMAKLRVLTDAECMDIVWDIQKNYRLPYPPRTIGEKIAEARQQSGAEKLKGHDIMALERFDPEVRHMIVFDVLSGDSPVGNKGDKMRLFLTDAGYQKFLDSQERGEVKLKNHAKVSGGHLHYDRRDRAL